MSKFIDAYITQGNVRCEDSIPCIDKKILKVKKAGNVTTIYMWVLFEEFKPSADEEPEIEQAFHIPTVVTVRETGEEYEMLEYWMPREGEYYAKDIKEKFPIYLWSSAMDSQRHIEGQMKRCREMYINTAY